MTTIISIFLEVLPESSSESGVPELLSSTSLIFLGMKYFKLANLKEDLLGGKMFIKKILGEEKFKIHIINGGFILNDFTVILP